MISPLSLVLTFLLALPTAYAHSHGESIPGDSAMALAQGHMTAFLHIAPGDTLWLAGWVPGRSSTLWGACIALALLAVGERWVAALRAGVDVALVEAERRDVKDENQDLTAVQEILLMRGAAPFVLGHAWVRGILQVVQATLGFMFMLAVMTYQVGFILSLVMGLGIGEMMYGRYTDAAYAKLM